MLVCCCVQCVGGRDLGVSDQYDYPRAGGRCACVLLCTVLEAEPSVYLINMIIQGLVVGVRVCCFVVCVLEAESSVFFNQN